MNERIDAHHHVWDLAPRDQPWITGTQMAPIRRSFSIDDLAGEAAACGVVATVLVQTVAGPEETPELLSLAASCDLVRAVTGWIDLTVPSAADDIAGLRSGVGGDYLRAIRHQVQAEPDPDWLRRPDVLRGIGAVTDAGLVYELLTLPHQLPAACTAVAAHPAGRFVLDHCSKPPIRSGELAPWEEDLRALARHDNVTCKLSGLVTEADWASWTVDELRPYTDVVIEAFGPDRVMFGSDWPVCLLAATYRKVVDAAEELTAWLGAPEREAVFRTTASRVYGLDQMV